MCKTIHVEKNFDIESELRFGYLGKTQSSDTHPDILIWSNIYFFFHIVQNVQNFGPIQWLLAWFPRSNESKQSETIHRRCC